MTDTIPLFQLLDGQPAILSAFFSTSKAAVKPEKLTDVPRQVVVYGDDAASGPLYLHLVVENLLSVNAGSTRVFSDVKFAVDFFAMNSETAKKAYLNNSLKGIRLDDDLFSFTVELVFGDQEITSSPANLADVVSLPKSTSKKPLQVTAVNEDPGTNRLYDLCFEIPFPSDDLKRLKDAPTYAMEVMAWAWVLSEHTKKQYKAGFCGVTKQGLDVSNQDERIHFLEEWAPASLVRLFLMQGQKRRDEYSIEVLPPGHNDPFVFDEPTFNLGRFSKHLPFKALEVGAQLGSVGVCSSNLETYYGNPLLHPHVELPDFLGDNLRSMGQNGIGTGTPSGATHDLFLHRDEHGAESIGHKPTIQKSLNIGREGYPFAVNELQNSREEQFLFRENSIAQWLNTIEQSIALTDAQPHAQPKSTVVLERGALAQFTKGPKAKVPVLSFNFLRDYREDVPERTIVHKVIISSVWEQKELDVGSFDTVSVVEATVKDQDGAFLLDLGKGIRCSKDRYLGWLHTKVKIEGDPDSDAWQAHPYCHRPILVAYELERDLAGAEAEKLKNAWVTREASATVALRFTLPDLGGGAPLVGELPFPFLDDKCGKKGRHLLLLYPTSITQVSRTRLLVSVQTNGVIDELPRHNNLHDTVQFELATPKTIVTYGTKEGAKKPLDGLFQGNPIISIESLSPLQTREKAAAADLDKYVMNNALEQGKFVLSFIPTYGGAASGIWELGVRIVDSAQSQAKPFPWEKSIELGAAILKEVLATILELKFAKTLPMKYVFDNTKSLGGFLAKLNLDLVDFGKRYERDMSPFKRGSAFQLDPNVKDRLVLARFLRREWEYKVAGGAIAVVEPTEHEMVDAFFVRDVNLGSQARAPFKYAFGPAGGFVERDDPSGHSSLEPWMDDYLTKLVEYKRKVPKELRTLAEYLKWISDPTHLQGIPFNSKLAAFLRRMGARLAALVPSMSSLLVAGRNGELTPEKHQELVATYTTMHLLSYLDTVQIRCPACGQEMQLNWGWCPYHPTKSPGSKELYTVDDLNKDGSWKDDFLKELADQDTWHLGEIGLIKYLARTPTSEDMSLFVHCSDFIILK